ncbi:MAG TPA: flavin reductase family protein [Ardenticatenaceae bacterium]|nr:flavin reductase family protein [Ardenticatenaceae bacterium]
MPIATDFFKEAMSYFATGVTIVTTRHGDEVHGMTVNAFCSVSLNPMLVLVSIEKTLATHAMIEASGVFAVNILRLSQMEWGERFAGLIPNVEDRFEGIAFKSATSGSPLLPGAIAWVDCRVWAAYDGGDHTLFLGEVLEGAVPGGAEPLLYYHRRWSRLSAEGPLTANPWPHDEDG